MYKVLVIATYDSFLRSGIKVAERISSNKNIEIMILPVKRNQLSARQLLESNAIKYKQILFSYDLDYLQYDIIILSVGNAATKKFIAHFYENHSISCKRPIIISIFPGLIFGHTESILSRIDTDIILVNSLLDKEKVNEILKVYRSTTKVIHYGLINIDINKKNIFSKRNFEKTIVFIEQIRIPETKEEKEFVVDKLINLAENYPEKEIIFKRRIIEREVTVHEDKISYIDILNKKELPTNFQISSEPIYDLYHKMDLCLSFSSTVLLEALYYGIPIAVISDLGINDNYALDKFLGSDIFLSFDEIERGIRPMPSVLWLEKNLYFDDNRDDALLQAIENMISHPSKLYKKFLFFKGRQYMNKSNKYQKLKKLVRSPRDFFIDSKFNKYLLGR
ncbi:DUF6716 putative glycosyltransferase [Actinobacillus arthritidis]|uniref:DUF6716 putative glycosyltransferase n=1 Tax=Actinobacillus arthritidis TaxID=157339 RepID=UPI0024426531|nr:DUF6716 putative glycosyltransferase [Actinobacillus arthritidis]WGE89088.1 hypothetical protein NYR89_08615 [Actinobacillus arthritidis]